MRRGRSPLECAREVVHPQLIVRRARQRVRGYQEEALKAPLRTALIPHARAKRPLQAVPGPAVTQTGAEKRSETLASRPGSRARRPGPPAEAEAGPPSCHPERSARSGGAGPGPDLSHRRVSLTLKPQADFRLAFAAFSLTFFFDGRFFLDFRLAFAAFAPAPGSRLASQGCCAGRRPGRFRPPVTSPEMIAVVTLFAAAAFAFAAAFAAAAGSRREGFCPRGGPADGQPQRHGTLVAAAAVAAVALVSPCLCVCVCRSLSLCLSRCQCVCPRLSFRLLSSSVCSPLPDPPTPPDSGRVSAIEPYQSAVTAGTRRAMLSCGEAGSLGRPKHCSVDRGQCLVRRLRPV